MIAVRPPVLGQARDGFSWRSKLYHLTYAGHIPKDMLLQLLLSISSVPVTGTSIVHEASDAEFQYDHTHFAWLWDKAVDLIGSRIMDVLWNGSIIHPNIQTRKSLKWMHLIFTRYHLGHKAGAADGFVEPVQPPWQKLPPCFVWDEYIVTEVSEAPDLLAGVFAAGILAKSVSDVLLLQKHKRPAPFEHNFRPADFLTVALPTSYTSGNLGTLHIYGRIHLGKTEWALAQFSNPILVTTRDALGDFDPRIHDGIVFDKMRFNEWTVEDCESLTDYTQPAAVKLRYRLVKIPKKTRKIVVTNLKDVWPVDPCGQLVGRRVVQLHITACMY